MRRNQIQNKPDIKDFTKNQLAAWFEDQGIRSYRAAQTLAWVYVHQTDDFRQMTDLSNRTRELLVKHFMNERLYLDRVESSKDGSKKYLFELHDNNFVESVLIPEKDHYTLCVSSQVGCSLGCRFCHTARSGLIRDLSSGEIISQIRDIQNSLKDPKRLTNIVFMGMGEPLANYRNVVDALKIITDSDIGLKFSTRRVTLSTAGLVPKLKRLGTDVTVNLAVSLNAANNVTRDMLMPVNRKYPLEALLEACAGYPLQKRRKITFEYVLIKGVNDSPEDAKQLTTLLRPIKAKVNLIPFNTHEDSDFECPNDTAISNFQNILVDNHFTTIVRYSKGQDISAACGQLRARVTAI